ncbi:uncharacterized protein BDZ99DRAFT_460930 [Mytilinidion resinicola]|uniref:Infection structure specific protein n=1 Tax=Mytilinidion resinicola TaxID=574789 RepID=A0A6A6YTM6_9PEZI|nr:uncharacterized protein BDZ99DRAFT_460930 [Mytilinidion resinicola]KAF2812160.1 hypothetical protein BDZ99DRAFT_460930 [Mytilinidion resinicola]
MRSTILLTTLFTATVLASPHPHAEIIQIRQVERRQDVSSIDINTLIPSGCIPPSGLLAVPTAPSAVLSALATWTNPCEVPSLTGAAGAEYTSYKSAISSWAKENSAKLESWESAYKTACPYAATMSLPTVVASNTALLSLASCGATAKSESAATLKSGAATSQSGSAATAANAATASGSNSASTGAAAQQTAFAAAAGILAGFAGVVAVL